MGKGVLYKFNASTWSKSQCKKMSATAVTDGKVKHANASTWYDNYPMESLHEAYFNVVWTQGYNGSGVKLDAATWGDHPRAGGSAEFFGLWGFNRTDLVNFVAGGVVQRIEIEVLFDDPGHAGNPYVNFYPHYMTSKPGSWSDSTANRNWDTRKGEQFNQTQYDYKRWVALPASAWNGGKMAGVVCWAEPTAANSCRFAGKTTSHELTAFNTRLWIQVLK